MYHTLAENLCIFCPFPEILWQTEIKDNILISVVEETSKPNVQAVAWILWAASGQSAVKI